MQTDTSFCVHRLFLYVLAHWNSVSDVSSSFWAIYTKDNHSEYKTYFKLRR